jgi:hypothetical protein
VTRTTTTQLIAEQFTSSNNRKKACFETRTGPRKYSLVFLFEEINALKKQLKPEKTAISNKRNSESLLLSLYEINLTTSSDEGESKAYCFYTSSKPFGYSNTKLAKESHPTTELVVS